MNKRHNPAFAIVFLATLALGAGCTTPSVKTTTLACTHSACVTGGPLLSTCDWCVGRINSAFPSCRTNWSQGCVNQVATLCVQRCDCATICTAGLAFNVGACPVTGRECDIHPDCCRTGWTAACITDAENTSGLICP